MFNEIVLSDEGRAMIKIRIRPFIDKIPVKVDFKLDTGADLTTISKKDLIDLGYSKDWIEKNKKVDKNRTISRAGGEEEAAIYIQIPYISILGLPFKNWTLYIREEDGFDYPNLLGLDMLLYFKFNFDYTTWILKIRPERKPLRKLSLLPNQEVGELSGDKQAVLTHHLRNTLTSDNQK